MCFQCVAKIAKVAVGGFRNKGDLNSATQAGDAPNINDLGKLAATMQKVLAGEFTLTYQVNPSESTESKRIHVLVLVSPSQSQWAQVSPSEPKWVQVNPSESSEFKWVQVNQVIPSESKWVQVNQRESK